MLLSSALNYKTLTKVIYFDCFIFNIVITAVQKWIERNSLQVLLVDEGLQEMLSHLLYWDWFTDKKYSEVRLQKLTDMNIFLPIIEEIGK